MINKIKSNYIILLVALATLTSCEYISQRRCEWYLMVDQDNQHLVEPGMISLCLRNFNSNKQKCSLQATIDLAESVDGKKLRASDVVIGARRTITEAPICTE